MVRAHEVVVDGLGDVEAAEIDAGFLRELGDDAAGVGRVVAPDIEEVADIAGLAGVQDLLAVLAIGLVARGAERRRLVFWRWPARWAAPGAREIDDIVFHQAVHAVAHAEDLLDDAALVERGCGASGRRRPATD
jgi:hypothetical protein